MSKFNWLKKGKLVLTCSLCLLVCGIIGFTIFDNYGTTNNDLSENQNFVQDQVLSTSNTQSENTNIDQNNIIDTGKHEDDSLEITENTQRLFTCIHESDSVISDNKIIYEDTNKEEYDSAVSSNSQFSGSWLSMSNNGYKLNFVSDGGGEIPESIKNVISITVNEDMELVVETLDNTYTLNITPDNGYALASYQLNGSDSRLLANNNKNSLNSDITIKLNYSKGQALYDKTNSTITLSYNENITPNDNQILYGYEDNPSANESSSYAPQYYYANVRPNTFIIKQNFKEFSPISTSGYFGLLKTPRVSYVDNTKQINGIENINFDNVINSSYMFNGCNNPNLNLAIENINLSNIKNTTGMFSYSNLIQFSNSDFNNVEIASFMFKGCDNLETINVENWKLNNVVNAQEMFSQSGITHLENDKKFELGKNIKYLSKMFAECNNLENLYLENLVCNGTANDASMYNFVADSKNLKNISFKYWNWKVANGQINASKNIKIFNNNYYLESITIPQNFGISIVDTNLHNPEPTYIEGADGHWYESFSLQSYTVSTIPIKESIFKIYVAKKPLAQPLPKAVYKQINNENQLVFYYDNDTHEGEGIVWQCPENAIYTSDIPWNSYSKFINIIIFDNTFIGWKDAKSLSEWFYDCSNCTNIQNISNFNTSNVTNMSGMFRDCSHLISLDLSNFDTSNVTNMSGMFNMQNYDSQLTTLDVSSFNTSNVTNMSGMFRDCSHLISLDLSNFNTSNVTDMSNMFNMYNYGSQLTTLDVSSFNTSNITNMSNMFYFCTELASLNVSNFDTSNVTNMSYMFGCCISLTTLNVSNFNTSNVTNMSCMFSMWARGSQLTTLDLSNFNTSSVTDMSCMFSNCWALTLLDITNFDTSNVVSMHGMFEECISVTFLDISNFNTTNTIDMSRMFFNCKNLEHIYCNNDWSASKKLSDSSSMFSRCSKLPHFDDSIVDKTYAYPDNGTTGYFTSKNSSSKLVDRIPEKKENLVSQYNLNILENNANVDISSVNGDCDCGVDVDVHVKEDKKIKESKIDFVEVEGDILDKCIELNKIIIENVH